MSCCRTAPDLQLCGATGAPCAVNHSSAFADPSCCRATTCAADGSLEDFDESGAGSGGNKKETAEEAAARVKLEAAKARESVRQALQTGLEASGSKRKQPEGAAAAAGGGRPTAKKGMLNSMLGDLSSSEEEEEE